jgi:hypothetical protein
LSACEVRRELRSQILLSSVAATQDELEITIRIFKYRKIPRGPQHTF